ncbi:MAG: dipeptide ABC transporter ATP-binding protein [Chloroflexi bacterium]|nr:dipeptide ABC transporter ATP-binding protein [Chloroflexota bacterium]MBM3154770.1 dipeptide ABC transporter ATP-binding protein [Chloroflexota bacterium]MBM3172735.1 dipeptide ABC transporter ATP-binding protein [Chloroflexota bacterium]MBM3175023.1 dipeptide ABC transporter ATP-binding protein [Chloroflexota bacterium]MBM4450037.1 dipeptide ABC transporter ATP-binding protein [Chloroflexota bacterium]
MKSTANHKLLQVIDLKKYYPVTVGLLSRQVGEVRAVDGVSFLMAEGEILGLVGESGCGKSTLGRTILRLEEPSSGKILYKGSDITTLDKERLRALRKEIQIVLQDPDASLDSRMTAGDSIAEPLVVHGVGGDVERNERVAELMKQVGLDPRQANHYPHEFSGGQKQRIGIARALAINPKLIIADEPVSALDVSVQAQILNLMMDIQEEFGLAYLFIAHDLAVIRHMAHRVAIMYLGKIVELADKAEIFAKPMHPYTQALLAAVPSFKTKAKKEVLLSGDVPSPLNPPTGCHFHPRCRKAFKPCSQDEPKLVELSKSHFVSCHLYT